MTTDPATLALIHANEQSRARLDEALGLFSDRDLLAVAEQLAEIAVDVWNGRNERLLRLVLTRRKGLSVSLSAGAAAIAEAVERRRLAI